MGSHAELGPNVCLRPVSISLGFFFGFHNRHIKQERTSNKCLCCPQKVNSMEGPKPQASGADKSDGPVQSASSSSMPRQQRCDRHQESEHLREAMRSLRGERNALQGQLQEKE